MSDHVLITLIVTTGTVLTTIISSVTVVLVRRIERRVNGK